MVGTRTYACPVRTSNLELYRWSCPPVMLAKNSNYVYWSPLNTFPWISSFNPHEIPMSCWELLHCPFWRWRAWGTGVCHVRRRSSRSTRAAWHRDSRQRLFFRAPTHPRQETRKPKATGAKGMERRRGSLGYRRKYILWIIQHRLISNLRQMFPKGRTGIIVSI